MSNQIFSNLLIIVLTILSLSIIAFLLYWILRMLFKIMDICSEKIISRFGVWLSRHRWSILSLEVLLLIGLILTVLVFFKGIIWPLIIYTVITVVGGNILNYLRKNSNNPISLLIFSKKIRKDSYLISRLSLLLENGLSFFYLLLTLELTLLFFAKLNWPISTYYFAFIVLPIYFNIWIYVSKFKLNRDKNMVNQRRMISYFILVVYVLFDCYQEFLGFLNVQVTDVYSIFFSISSVVFIAIDRFTKALVDDYEKYKSEKV